jgi:hypothetical protein
MTVESTTQALCDLALRFGEGDEESMVKNFLELTFMSILVCLLTLLSLWPKTCELAHQCLVFCVAFFECLMEM